jgi:N6-adenosine-specific RNA methylase IME4
MTTLFDIGAPNVIACPPVFRTVVADCPWAPRDALPGPKRGAAKHYQTMPTADLRALSHRFPAIADDAILFSWRLASMPFDGLDVCRAWGFEPVSEIVWVKIPRAGRLSRGRLLELADGIRARKVRILLGHYVRASHETCIIAARPGAAARIKAHNIPSVFFAPIGKHSEKPSVFYDIVERLAPGPYLELFARQPRGASWTAIGDALGTTLDLPLAPSRSA